VVKPPMAVTNAVSWRSEGIKHRKNEIFLDVVERLNLLVAANGTLLRSEILGALTYSSMRLSALVHDNPRRVA
jgi:AP-1 complex subunit mu